MPTEPQEFAALRKLATSRDAGRIDRQAQKLADPIERLQYLRQATAAAGYVPARPRWRPAAAFLLLAAVSLRSDANVHRQPGIRPAASLHLGSFDVPNVWIVEETKDYETYSNGLRIETELAVSNQPRSWPLLGRDSVGVDGPLRSQPAGIVFHTTESQQAPFEAGEKHHLQRIGKELLLFVRGKRAYHYVIDRFGRVHRIVAESDAANHAGNSVWADSRWLYLDLNASFLGVAFEASMQTGQPPLTQAQIHAARVLTEMLRSKYNLAAENCVTHAQVSVNPENMHIGWHADWGKDFPFREIGLPENYEQPLPSLYLFGFVYDPVYRSVTGPAIWRSLAASEKLVEGAADQRRMAAGEYRALLRKRYRDLAAALKQRNADDEN
ncbi:MAG TPA: peptidoglycan recognition family protein [Bryobacteraceae bacterium]|nr:peptidoglycan recognition family protein [Bryobacteraceae bacterium]